MGLDLAALVDLEPGLVEREPVGVRAPAITVVAVFTVLGVWIDFFGPLLYLADGDLYTVPVALATQVSRIGTDWNKLMAANLIAIVPPLVIYFVAQKQLIGGIASVGLKG